MPLSQNLQLITLLKNSLADRLPLLATDTGINSPVVASGTLPGGASGGRVLAYFASSDRSVRALLKTTGQYFALAAPWAAGSINSGMVIFTTSAAVTVNKQFMVCGENTADAGSAIAIAHPQTDAWSKKVTPNYKLYCCADNNPDNLLPSTLGTTYAICVAGESAGAGKLLRSIDFGATWTDIALPGGTTPLKSICGNGNTWLVAQATGNALISTNNGATWTVLTDANAPHAAGANIPGVIVGGRVSGHYYVGANANTQTVISFDAANWALVDPTDNTYFIPVSAVTLGGITIALGLNVFFSGIGVTKNIFWSVDGKKWVDTGVVLYSTNPDIYGIVRWGFYNSRESAAEESAEMGVSPYAAVLAFGGDMAAKGALIQTSFTLNPAKPQETS